MDVYCRFDREPWDNDTIHEEVAERHRIFEDEKPPKEAKRPIAATDYHSVAADFRRYGCGAFPAFRAGMLFYDANGDVLLVKCAGGGGGQGDAIGVIQDLLGDDVDGATALIEDFGLV